MKLEFSRLVLVELIKERLLILMKVCFSSSSSYLYHSLSFVPFPNFLFFVYLHFLSTLLNAGPALSVQWSKDGTKVASGGADKAARIFDVSTGQATQVAVHDAPVKEVKWIDMPGSPSGLLATGSWDKVRLMFIFGAEWRWGKSRGKRRR